MNTKEILIEARQLISNPVNWCQGYLATDASGAQSDVFAPEATCFCSLGAIRKVAHRQPGIARRFHAFLDAHLALSMAIDARSVGGFNDARTHSEVLKMFDDAILAQG